MSLKVAFLLLGVSAVLAATPFNPNNEVYTANLGDHVASTLQQFKQLNIPFTGVTPTSTQDSYKVSGDCNEKLGYLWEPSGGITQENPLSLYFTKAGQIAGMRVDIWGSDAAQGKQISEGYYIAVEDNHWYLSMSFRKASDMCSTETASETVGDRLVINQVFEREASVDSDFRTQLPSRSL